MSWWGRPAGRRDFLKRAAAPIVVGPAATLVRGAPRGQAQLDQEELILRAFDQEQLLFLQHIVCRRERDGDGAVSLFYEGPTVRFKATFECTVTRLEGEVVAYPGPRFEIPQFGAPRRTVEAGDTVNLQWGKGVPVVVITGGGDHG